jgi:hypothetical protein
MPTLTAEPPCTVDDVSSGGKLADNLAGPIKLSAHSEFLGIMCANYRVKRSSNVAVDCQPLPQFIYETTQVLEPERTCIEQGMSPKL